ncbi:alpha-D-ribose 1-methylphosphonate 5-triphosphate synthase subunit PhnI [Trinickia symbiotica]|uniref:Carbon-phosphorus lyase complex subunit PhnI n=1 Tax=Trinickia symbiotica TaxID=863227 RepID=A0A2N7X1P3_9BURK|nr:carbon-phosphorus lyase complex subunit PhnI [Trinickia symbiotica]PMS35472.1 carbon-phosphorus lyase complex subunit PhnI [Trinickia symbiotica]PPK45501.1 alpha-D-ribose 1-methylphosphonate 5-triphosphate synthase subunit PhnI [Trinickia symbiotica]
MYVAVKGGERAIEASWRLLEAARRGDRAHPELTIAQIRQQMRLAVARVMTEGSVYDEDLAALAIKQAAGDLVEAIFLLRAYRTTLPRFGYTRPIDTERMEVQRRISATFKDVPGGQLLGPTYDYTQRLLDFSLLAEEESDRDHEGVGAEHSVPPSTGLNAGSAQSGPEAAEPTPTPRVVTLLDAEGLIEQERPSENSAEPVDLALEPLLMPAERAVRLQNLARADEGFLLSTAYSTQRGYARNHPFAGEIRFGKVAVEMEIPELGFAVELGEIEVTECQMINQFAGSKKTPPSFTQGYGLAFGHSERKAMAMSLIDRALRAQELGEAVTAPAQDPEFMLYHSDNVEASGFVQHLKLPHYVDFQSELELIRRLRAAHPAARAAEPEEDAA